MAVVAFFEVMALSVNLLCSVSMSLTQETPPLIYVAIEVIVYKRKSARFHCCYTFLVEKCRKDSEISSHVGAVERNSWLMHDCV
jgi:hypothetical protein